MTQANPKTGNTPLHVAARGGRENVVSYLLTFTRQAGTSRGGEGEGEGGEERGRDVNCRNKSGATPLELTVAQGQNSIVQYVTFTLTVIVCVYMTPTNINVAEKKLRTWELP